MTSSRRAGATGWRTKPAPAMAGCAIPCDITGVPSRLVAELDPDAKIHFRAHCGRLLFCYGMDSWRKRHPDFKKRCFSIYVDGMSKLLVFCNDLDYFLRHRVSVVDHLVERGHDVDVMTGGRSQVDASGYKWRLTYIHIDRFAFRPFADAKLFLRALRVLRASRPDALHLITLKPAVFVGFAALAATRLGFGPKRILITIPGLGRLMSPSTSASLPTRIAQGLVSAAMRALSRHAGTRFTFETEHDRQTWIRQGLIRTDNSTVINGAGVDPHHFFPAAGVPRQRPVRILFASRLLKAKGLEAFLLAAENFKNSNEIEFVVAGMVEPHDPDGYSVEELSRNAAIRFLGEAGDMPNLLRTVDIVCLPTIYGEGIPRILIEAAATGLPGIATDTPGCRAIIVPEQTGLLIRSGDPLKMAGALDIAVRRYLDEDGLLKTHGVAAFLHFSSGHYSQEAINSHFARLLLDQDAF